MKIRTPKDVEKLDQKIKEELGVDVRKYRNEEVAENFVALLVFPKYVISWVIRPVLIAIGLFIVGFFLLDLVHVEYFLYGVVGIFLFLGSGLLAGLLFLVWKMKKDMWGIIDYSLDIMKSAVNDMSQVNHQITAENRKNVLGLLFKGILHIVTIPVISKVIAEKVPIIGGIVSRLVRRILIIVSNVVKFDEYELQQELRKKEGESRALQIYLDSISSVSSGLEKVMKFTFGVAQFPLKIGFGVVFLMLIIFVYLVH